jgi:NADH-quinone oxidoreductase subunit K
MKCKRCRSTVPDDMDTCPNCGQDLSSLRQLLRDFYSEDPVRIESQDPPTPEPEVFPKSDPQNITLGSEDIRIVTGPVPDYGHDFPVESALPGEEPDEEEEKTSTWDRALRGGFWLRSMAFAADQVIRLELAVEEWVVNLCTYAYAGRDGEIEVAVQKGNEELLIEISDDGPPFDPTASAEPDVGLPLERIQPGGLGLLLIRRLTNRVGYARKRKRNIITLFRAIELMLNAVNLAFVAFARALGQLDGLVFVFFVIVVAAAEAAVGLAIIITIMHNRQTLNVERINLLKF